MSKNDKDQHSKTPTTIKIAAKDASQRATGGGADPGPGDMSAEPSEMPEPVNLPEPPTGSDLVVKTSGKSVNASGATGASGAGASNSRQIKTIQDPISLPKSRKSSASTRMSGAPASSRVPSTSGKSAHGASQKSTSGGGVSGAKSRATFEGSARGVEESARAGEADASAAAGPSASTAMQANSQTSPDSGASGAPGQTHDEIEEGEGEVEQASPSPGPGPAPGPSGSRAPGPSSPVDDGQPSGGVDSAPASSGGGTSKMSPKTSAVSKKSEVRKTSSASSAASSASSHAHSNQNGAGKKKKKVTKFRYHKRITVRTHGKTSPSTIMHKVNKKDHKAGITPSTIEDMDTEELMKRAGIKANKKTHWRVRLRQTKRMTKGGKTVTQTKIAYRDSEGNKRVKTSLSPFCKTCGKKLEECKCEDK